MRLDIPVDNAVPFVDLISLDRCRRNAGTFVPYGDLELAVFWLTNPERVVVTDNACPHAGGNLSAGEVAGNVVTCPWHQWKFDLDRGACTHSEHARIRRFPAEIREGSVWVRLPARQS